MSGPVVARVLALGLLVLALPVLALLGVLVWLSLGSPVLFRQVRSGRGGVGFTLVKFRTMKDLRGVDGALLPDPLRTTRLGNFLRRTRLDELPSLVNVVSGDLAFIGPRPLLPKTLAAMGEEGRLRGAVRPGLTGLSQVSGNTLLTLDEKVALDLWYIDHRSLWLDSQIILRTVLVMVGGERRAFAVPGFGRR
ncbi:sugar transferase [Qipengyuania sp. NPDC077563]|uniref:sugar transferase n=1 Tax=Qipengyuania sp. NPDC077563 TaxID=3364497 RepID=UPI00384B3BDE